MDNMDNKMIEDNIKTLYIIYGNKLKIVNVTGDLYAFVSPNDAFYKFIDIRTLKTTADFYNIVSAISDNLLGVSNVGTGEFFVLNLETFEFTKYTKPLRKQNNLIYSVDYDKHEQGKDVIFYDTSLNEIGYLDLTESVRAQSMVLRNLYNSIYIAKGILIKDEVGCSEGLTGACLLRYDEESDAGTKIQSLGYVADAQAIRSIGCKKCLAGFSIIDLEKLDNGDVEEEYRLSSICEYANQGKLKNEDIIVMNAWKNVKTDKSGESKTWDN